MKKRLLSLVLALTFCLGLSVPASAVMLPIALHWESRDHSDTKRERVPGFSSEVNVEYFRTGGKLDISLAPEFDGNLQSIYILIVGTKERVYYFNRNSGLDFESASVVFEVGTTPEGQTVSLSDPNEVYILTAEATDADGSPLLQRSCYRVDPNRLIFEIYDDGRLAEYHEYYGEAGHVTIPDNVTSIGQYVFRFRDDITGVTIPASVTSIGSGAFANCTGLTELVIPDSVTSIGSGAFSSCTGLKEVVIPDSVTELGGSAFASCPSLERVVIGNGITEIPRGTFEGCFNLKEVAFGKNVTSIGDFAFEGCTGLTSLTIPQSVEYIGFQAFRNCSSLAEINIPETTVVSNVHSVFDGCTLLDIPPKDMNGTSGKIVGCPFYETDTAYVFDLLFLREDGILNSLAESIGKNAWEYRKNQTPQDLFGGDLGEYGRKSFAQLREESSTELILPEGVTTIIDLAGVSDYNSIERLVLPNSLQVIGDGSGYAFYNCTNLKEIVFPSPEHISPALKYQDLASLLGDCHSLEQIVNCPNQALYERIAANQRLETAWKGIDPKTVLAPQSKRITDLSDQICAGCATDYEKAKAVFDWMTANISYDYANKETGKGTIFPEEVLDSKLTVCDGYARLTQAFLLAQKIPTVYISGPANNGGGIWEGHGWNMAYVDGRWIYIDSTWGRTANGKCDPFWFDLSLAALSMSHWGDSSYADPNAHHYVGSDDTPAEFAAAPNRSTVLVNGEQVAFDAYTINQNNYFKLRDVGQAFDFDVTWDGANNTIVVDTNQSYTAD